MFTGSFPFKTQRTDSENPRHFIEPRLQRLFEFLRCWQRLDPRQQVQIFGKPWAVVKQYERRSSNQDEMLRQGGKQCNRGLLHKNEDMGLVLAEVPFQIPRDPLLQGHYQNTPYMVVLEIIFEAWFSISAS